MSIGLQTLKPDKIYLWVSKDAYLADQGIESEAYIREALEPISEELLNLIEIKWTKNLGPYRKLLPALDHVDSQDLIVTADDDLVYGKDWLKNLIEVHKVNPNEIAAARVRKARYNRFGRKRSYLFWDIMADEQRIESDEYVVTFGGGVVLKKSYFRQEDINDSAYLTIAKTTDDLWYSKLLMRNKKKVVSVPKALAEVFFIEHDQGLTYINNKSRHGRSFMERLIGFVQRLAGYYLGTPACGNDQSLEKINHYFLLKDKKDNQA
jgi:hypothetical protein